MRQTPLHKLLTDFIKKYGKIKYREMEQFCKDNGYHSYTGARRLQEVRQPAHRNYDPEIGTIEENGTIKWYVYELINSSQTPQNAPDSTIPTKPLYQPAKEEIHTPRGWAYYPPPEPTFCCQIAKASDNRLHARGCETQKSPV